jgi:hypothetical protein
MMAKRDVARAVAAVVVLLFVLVVGSVGVAMAAAPNITIDDPLTGSSTNNQTSPFNGATDDVLDPVTLAIYELPSLPPVASFQWFPSAPRVGETVSLVSTSTDVTSPITGFAWSLAGNGAFNAGAPALTTSFSTPGGHVVRLRITTANGLSSVVAETIVVTAPTPTLMQPFPVVRIAGSENASGVKISLLTVQAPGGAHIAIRCRGRGCPKAESRVVASGRRASTTLVEFRRFERSLRAGSVLEIRVSKGGEIGKYTRFTIRRGKLPVRVDTCLSAAGIKPIACPSS